MAKILNNSQFRNKLRTSDKLVVMDFFATWCGPCKMLGAELEDIVNSRGEIKIVKVDVDENPILAQQYGIMSVPTLLYFNNGKLVKKDIGFMPKEVILDNFKNM